MRLKSADGLPRPHREIELHQDAIRLIDLRIFGIAKENGDIHRPLGRGIDRALLTLEQVVDLTSRQAHPGTDERMNMGKKTNVYGFAIALGLIVSAIGFYMQVRQEVVYCVSAITTFSIIRALDR